MEKKLSLCSNLYSGYEWTQEDLGDVYNVAKDWDDASEGLETLSPSSIARSCLCIQGTVDCMLWCEEMLRVLMSPY